MGRVHAARGGRRSQPVRSVSGAAARARIDQLQQQLAQRQAEIEALQERLRHAVEITSDKRNEFATVAQAEGVSLSVARRLFRVVGGPAPPPRVPTLGLATLDVEIAAEIGMLAAWQVPAVEGVTGRWAILVHGRGAQRGECLRAVPVLHDLGFTALIPSYRNDIGAPSSSDGRYSLGLSEWRDLEAAILYAVENGAQEIVLFGYSMGAAIILQTLDRSWLSDRVSAVVLDAPVIDWSDVLRHHGALNKIPGPVGRLSRSLIGRRWARRLVGVHEPIDVALTNWEHRAGELTHPTLLIHSLDDEFVPVGPSISLAAKRPDLVRFEPWREARHTHEWNVDPERWDAVVRSFLTDRVQPA